MLDSKFALGKISNILILLIVNEIFYSGGAEIKQPVYVQKCHEYQNAVFQSSGDTSKEKCNFNKTETPDKESDINLLEFPHLALIGYNFTEDISYNCVGVLVSDRFVLVAAHCIAPNIAKVRVGGISDSDKNKEDINIEQVIVHPNYNKIIMPNDIALLKLEKRIQIDQFKRPACLPSIPYWSQSYAFETYINRTESKLVIEKLKVEKISEDECKKLLLRVHITISYDSQICAESKDRYASGGPLQIYHSNEFCMYEIVGLASFGNSASSVSSRSDVYTRINPYIDWIESIVWA